ncbi:MAG: SgcJ/EcaC family oxidoreductase [Verrucomicrobia bacterium]|nr:SgcJ/EcaC family oxidoreductase [Verrucomicrobiota bacterium]
MIRSFALPSAMLLLSLASARSQDTDPNKASLEALAANAQAYVNAHNEGNAEAIAKLFIPEGEIILSSGEIVSGRAEIQQFYADLFSGEKRPRAALEAGSVRFVTPKLAIEDGTLHVTRPTGEVISHHYTSTQMQQDDGSWLTASIRDEIEDVAPASEKLLPLEWMIGDWIIEKNGLRTFLTFKWSDDGPFIDGKAVTEMAGEENTSSTYRIGWNNNRKNYISWAFDTFGGHMISQWTKNSSGWLLRTSGVTADGEVNHSTQTIEPDSSLQHYIWSTRDQTIGGNSLPDGSVRVVKRPPDAEETTEAKPSEQ